jgi:multisubunit Na+/H+ antiporter MnhB subunit
MKKHLWQKTSTYLILIGVCVAILLLEVLVITILDKMGKGETINDTIAESVAFFICVPGIIVGIIGAIICAVRKK